MSTEEMRRWQILCDLINEADTMSPSPRYLELRARLDELVRRSEIDLRSDT